MKGNNYSKTGLWMVPITKRTNSDQQTHFMSKIGPIITNIGVNQQVNDRIITQFGVGARFMANTIHTSSKGELANYHHQ